jgi:hypothetical protein
MLLLSQMLRMTLRSVMGCSYARKSIGQPLRELFAR